MHVNCSPNHAKPAAFHYFELDANLVYIYESKCYLKLNLRPLKEQITKLGQMLLCNSHICVALILFNN